MKIVITEEVSGKDTVFYAREQPYERGRSYESTATSLEGALWNVQRLNDVDIVLPPWKTTATQKRS